ncbi:hypothetical protein F5879DRAFT_471364 [Lentinula edodes]|uniref:Polyadenylate-binding protein 1 n=1 Tax=Lentinula edodes TaxID=5353 RepID=A0A1Q3EHM3_LENED|nr:uncharacterized protein C8R40DRAFT_459376 [Lentinula edodes]KAF8823743.1 hypothetical protein HHX47_DHR9000284 [Lentinula edodes]KAH7880020.1 hypothetical protein C8R40DRAFT_459376 [Lentinula edodes]KAJ3899805.1 hypothetical protein F5879DRAFT_471364 [Lentinula edodes]KAJ3923213.1 hypothetical protein F5877DRAFT_74529 [Lentinula edodes]GAW06680.1 polyadenylate-binding protein 1 [Lentinula edodes]
MSVPAFDNFSRARASRYSYNSPPSKPCAGFDYNGHECCQLASGDGFCFSHKGQKSWSIAGSVSLEERRRHANGGRCNGVAASTGNLCNRKIWGFTFCHSHRDQQPPAKFFEDVFDYFATPNRGSELATRSATVKENMMAFCLVKEEWSQNGRNARRRAEEEAEKRRNAAEEAQRAWQRQQEQEAAERRKKAEEEKKKAHAFAEKLRQEYARQKAAEEERQRKYERNREEQKRKEEEKQREAEELAKAKRMKDTKDKQDIVTRYRRSCIEFDKVSRFSDMRRASFTTIPWPVLRTQDAITPSEISWEFVEKFFHFVKDFLGPAVHRSLLEDARKRYHPNRWAAKNVVNSVVSKVEREQLESAGNTVSQAINSIFSTSFL